MHDQAVSRAAVVVAMPADVDCGTVDQAYDQIYAAVTAGAPVVIADFTVTTYCDCAACWPSRAGPPPATPSFDWRSR